jgi:hypothetical protein
MAGPEKPEPKQALSEAKKDRRKKNTRRVASGSSNQSTKAENAGEDSANKQCAESGDLPNTSETSDPSNALGNATNVAIESSKAGNDDEKQNAQVTVTTKDPDQSKTSTSGAAKQRKSLGRRSWWKRRSRRNGKENSDGGQAASDNGVQEDTTKAGEDNGEASNKAKDNPAMTGTTNAAAAA